MIAGIGTDLVEVARLAEKLARNPALRQQLFCQAEIDYCEAQPRKEEHYAARFAAKEAFLKASGQGLQLGYTLSGIEVYHDAQGKPGLRLHGNFEAHAAASGWKKIHLSLSHIPHTACAFVVIEQ